MKWAEDVRLTILPSTPPSLQLLFMFSSKRFVRRKWPAIQVKRYCILRISMLITYKTSLNRHTEHSDIQATLFYFAVKLEKHSNNSRNWGCSANIEDAPMWLVAKCNSRPSQESLQYLVITPALLLPKCTSSQPNRSKATAKFRPPSFQLLCDLLWYCMK